MPELPEVEVVAQTLSPKVLNKTIQQVILRLPRLLLGVTPKKFEKQLQGQKILQLQRRGKYLIFILSQDCLIIHLGMTGQLTAWKNSQTAKNKFSKTMTNLPISQGKHFIDKHTHLVLKLSQQEVYFRDVRTFGKIIFVQGLHWQEHPRIAKLGVEPLSLTWKTFKLNLLPTKSSRRIKALLLEQSFVVGLGNIYCDEALFFAGICPYEQARELNLIQWKVLFYSIQKVLLKGIKNSGTTFSDFKNANGTKGKNQEFLMVYGRSGQLCKKCKTILTKTTLVQRTTVHCSQCQSK